jgi:hypothetical protein
VGFRRPSCSLGDGVAMAGSLDAPSAVVEGMKRRRLRGSLCSLIAVVGDALARWMIHRYSLPGCRFVRGPDMRRREHGGSLDFPSH